MFERLLNIFNIRPDKNQKWILLSVLISGLLGTYTIPTLTKAIITELPAQWIAFQSLVSSMSGLAIGILWRGTIRRAAIRWFSAMAIAECVCGFCVGMYLAFVSYNVWVFAICSLIYTNLISIFVGKCIMAFKTVLWPESEREVYDNNLSVVTGIVCIIGYLSALLATPGLKASLTIWALCCVFDDIGWIIVYVNNRKPLISVEKEMRP